MQSCQSGGDYRISYPIDRRPTAPIVLQVGDTEFDITSKFGHSEGKDWPEMIVTQQCTDGTRDNIAITSQTPLTIRIANITRQDLPEDTQCSF